MSCMWHLQQISFHVQAFVGGSSPSLASAPNSVMADRMNMICVLYCNKFMGSNPVGAIK